MHKTANVLDALPKRLQPRAKTVLHEMADAPSRADAKAALELLAAAQERWRRFNGHELVADVLDDVTFKDGV